MARFSTKHHDREKTFFIRSFNDGLNEEVSPLFLPLTALSRCHNMKYSYDKAIDGNDIVVLTKRQGTEKISNSALPSGADVLACTYYIAGAKYILATASKIYYLDASLDPIEIGSISGVPTFTEFHGKLIIHDSGNTKAWNGTTFETLTNLYTDEIIETGDGAEVDFSGTVAHPAIKSASLTITYTDTTEKTITSNASGTLSGDVAAHELMPNLVDRDFSGASAWSNVDINAYNETGDLTITASAAGQYCTCPVLSAPTTSGKRYRMTFTVANLVGTWTIKSFDGAKTIGTVTVAGAQSFDWTASTTGGYRIVAVANNSSGDFDDFTLTTNVVDFTTGVYSFRCSGAPDNTTSVYATYEMVSGAPKSKAGFVRANRLYTWGNADYPSRVDYTAVNDEDAWDSSSNGGYIDLDPLDGYSLVGCANFFESIVAVKGNSLKRIDNFPDDTIFRAEPLLENTGSIAYRTCLSSGGMVSFLSKEGWLALVATDVYGDISKTSDLSKNFRSNCIKFSTSDCYSEYNQIDHQLWLTIYNNTVQLPYIYVINLTTGGQLSTYAFEFDHSCYKYVNSEMLIGGADGNLYRLFSGSSSRYKDNDVSYSADTYIRGPMTNWGAGFNRKHNKKLFPQIYGKAGSSCVINIYTDGDYTNPVLTETFTTGSGVAFIYEDGQDVLIYEMDGLIGGEMLAAIGKPLKRKFNYSEVMFEIANIEGSIGFDFFGIDFSGAIIGD
jgi:hypothetical protein